MKKILTILICSILFIVLVLSMTACSNSKTQKQLDDLQDKLTQQQTQLNELEETLNKLVKSLPYEVTMFATASSYFKNYDTAYVIDSQESLQQMFDEFDASVEDSEWYFTTEDGTTITKDFFQDKALNFDKKAFLVSVFSSSSGGAKVVRHSLWKSSDVLHVEIDYTHTGWQYVSSHILIMEVDRNYVVDVNNILLEVDRKPWQ